MSHGRTCVGEHLVLCHDRDGHLNAFPELEHPNGMADAVARLVQGLTADPEKLLCLVGACAGHRDQQAKEPSPW